MSTLNILCVICSEYYHPEDEIYSTGCGHLFHKTCLYRWLETSHTCPECRQGYNAFHSRRVYLNFSQPTEEDLENLRIRLKNPEWRTLTASEVDGVLVYDPAYKPLESGVDLKGNKVYVARCKFKTDLVPANYVPSKNAAYLPWGCAGHKVPLSDVEYLVDDGYYCWVTASNGRVPENAVIVGYASPNTSYRDDLYTGRAQYRGITYPGKVHPSHSCLYMACEGKEVNSKEYEVLVRTAQKPTETAVTGNQEEDHPMEAEDVARNPERERSSPESD